MSSRVLARMGADVANPQWATQFRSGLNVMHEAGDTGSVLLFLDIYAQSLAATDHAEAAAILAAAVAELSPHMSNPNSVVHRRITNERLLTKLGEERFRELTERGANFGYEEAVALAFAELDRVIVNDNPG